MVSRFLRPFSRARRGATISKWCFVLRHSCYFFSSVRQLSLKPPIHRIPTSRKAFTTRLSTLPTSIPAASSPTPRASPQSRTPTPAQVCSLHSLRQRGHPGRHLFLRPLHDRQHLPQRPARRNSPRPLRPRADHPSAQAVWRTHRHPGAHQLRHRWPPCLDRSGLRSHARGQGQDPDHDLRRQGMCARQHSRQAQKEVRPRRTHPPRPLLRLHYAAQDLYTLMFAFTMQFDNDAPQPMVPGSVIR